MSLVCFVKIDKLEYRAVIKFFILDKLTPKKSWQKFTETLILQCQPLKIVSWILLESDLTTATTTETIEKVHDIVLDDKYIKVRRVRDATASVRWMSHLLNADYLLFLLTKVCWPPLLFSWFSTFRFPSLRTPKKICF